MDETRKEYAGAAYEHPKYLRYAIWGIVIGVIALSAILIYSTTEKQSIDCKADAACFIERANLCKAAALKLDQNGTAVSFEIANACNLTKRIITLPQDEPKEMRTLLEDKAMFCPYQKGSFNPSLITTLTIGIENCRGPLAMALQQIKPELQRKAEAAMEYLPYDEAGEPTEPEPATTEEIGANSTASP